ncbi:endogenous retrovirus group K member 7 Gag polyprotein-like [Myotis lucifugus]|uniref:endogenous retrovirus group K member 7 Gag polyprotein-like n=1 Tax=Myotis lucifugus TaxID=59463 RepID=UPI0006D7049C|nr:endogenous retrovirus group K member 7 Gag polyprotein-like [Myotis lucifugus]
MGNLPPSARAPQARALHALLQSRLVKVSEKELQTHWEYLLQSNPWLIEAPIWDPSIWEKVLKRIRSAEVHEENQLPPSLTPAILAILACLSGAPPEPPVPVPTAFSATVKDEPPPKLPLPPYNSPVTTTTPSAPEGPPEADPWEVSTTNRAQKEAEQNETKTGEATTSAKAAQGRKPSAGPPQQTAPAPLVGDTNDNPWTGLYQSQCRQRDMARFSLGLETQAFLVNINPTAPQPQAWIPPNQKELLAIRKAVQEDGLSAPYTQQLLENFSINLNCPHNWKCLSRTILAPGDMIQWKALFYEQCKQQAEHNRAVVAGKAHNLHDEADALQGEGVFSSPAVQAQGHARYFDQVRLCAMRAFAQINPRGKPTRLSKLVQGSNEEFSEFLHRVREAVDRKVTHAQAAEALTRELVWEGANTERLQAIAPVKAGSIDDWVLTCGDVGSKSAATLVAELAAHINLGGQSGGQKGARYECKGIGHFAKDCPNRKRKQGGEGKTPLRLPPL